MSTYWLRLRVVLTLFVRGAGLFPHDVFCILAFVMYIDPMLVSCRSKLTAFPVG